jgi:surface polysaccharide O-acyltransferase-like enzyme
MIHLVNYNYLNIARVLSSYAVVWLHVSARVVTTSPNVGNLDWWTGNLADSAARWCVPVFVMISGALLIPKASEAGPEEFIRYRIPKILKPTLFWTIVYTIILIISSKKIDVLSHFKLILAGVPYFHLWYMYMLLGLYLMAPYIAVATRALGANELRILTIAMLCVSSAESMLGGFGEVLFFLKFLPYVGYFIAGHALTKQDLHINKMSCFIVFAISTLSIAALTAALFPYIGEKSWNYMYGYLNPLVIIQSISIFLFMKNTTIFPNLSRASDLTLGVYLIHPLSLSALSYSGINGFTYSPIFGIPLTTVIAYALSAFAAYMMKSSHRLRQFV